MSPITLNGLSTYLGTYLKSHNRRAYALRWLAR